MRFNFCLANHDPISKESLLDAALPMIAALNHLGHHTVLADIVAEDAVNVFFDGFSDFHVAQLLQSSARFGIIGTEWYEDGKFNGGRGEDAEAKLRNFLLASNRAEFIWALADAPGYRQMGKPFALTHIGYEPECHVIDDGRPFVDFFAYGAFSVERAKLISELRNSGIRLIWPGTKIPKKQRDDMIRSCRYVLGLEPVSGIKHFSTTRLASAMHNDRPFVDVDALPQGTDLVMQLNHMLDIGWRNHRNAQLKAFKDAFDMRRIMESAIAQVGLK